MRAPRLALSILAATFVSAAATADISTDMKNITRFCLHYGETGQITNLLLQKGFSQKGRKFKKSYNRGVIGGTKPVITVDPRKSRSGYSCSANFGILNRHNASTLINIAIREIRQLGYTESVVTSSRGKRISAFVKNGIAIQLGGSTRSEYSTYSAFIYFQRLN